MNIVPKVKRLINSKKFNSLLDEEDLQGIYNLDEIRETSYSKGNLTEVFLNCGINPLDYMRMLPKNFACGAYFPTGTFEIPSHISNIDDFAFSECSSLESIKILGSPKYIGSYAFNECTSLLRIDIPYSVGDIGGFAFKDCFSLEKVLFGKGSVLNSIDFGAFDGCQNLRHIELPRGLRSLGASMFDGCDQLKCITYEGTMEEWNKLVERSVNWSGRHSTIKVQCIDGVI